MSELSSSEAMPPRLVNFYVGEFSLEDTPIQDVNLDTLGRSDPGIEEDSVVFVRSANVLGEMDDTTLDKTLQYYRSILAEEGKLHIYEPRAPRALGAKLLQLLQGNGFGVVSEYDPAEDFASINGKEIGNNPADIRLAARSEKKPHTHDALLSQAQFSEKCVEFRRERPDPPEVSWVIAVYNEARNLPHFLAFLENACDETGMKREFIFVVNGCTDTSQEIIENFITQTNLSASLTDSDKGIIPAFRKGIAERSLSGYVGRFDADVVLHPHTLDLMQMHLVDNEEARVTYAEPLTLESKTIFNTAAHHPGVMTKRLYYTGKASLYRQNPYLDEGVDSVPPQLIADDIFTSFNYIYRRGFKAISRAPHAVVYEKVIGNFEDLVKQTSRANSEIKRTFEAYPHFTILGDLTEQTVAPGEYHDLLQQANLQAGYVEEWTRLESTK